MLPSCNKEQLGITKAEGIVRSASLLLVGYNRTGLVLKVVV